MLTLSVILPSKILLKKDVHSRVSKVVADHDDLLTQCKRVNSGKIFLLIYIICILIVFGNYSDPPQS